jgi:hypothetical protein
MDDDLVEETGLETLSGDVGSEDDDVRAVSIRMSRNRPVTPFTTGGCAGGSWRSTKNGPR